MERMLSKLEFMLMGLRQLTLSAVYAWFPELKKEDILEALQQSPKFKVEGNIVTLKSETELYEEELQKDILKDLMGEADGDDDLLGYDDDLDLIAEEDNSDFGSSNIKLDDEVILVNSNENNLEDIVEDPIVDSQWVEAKEAAEEIPEVEVVQPVQGDIASLEENTANEDYFNYYYNSANEEVKEEKNKIEEKVVENVVENVIEKVVGKVVQVTDLTKVKGSDICYEDLVRIIDEYNDAVESKLNYAIENKFEVRVKAIKSFYENKYNVRIKEEGILGTTACIFSLIHKKKGMEVAYLIVCEKLNELILNYMLDHYDDEVVYFCPVEGSEVEFEVGLNEFYLKDTDVIFDKFLEHYVVVEECDVKIKNLEVIVGSN